MWAGLNTITECGHLESFKVAPLDQEGRWEDH